MNTHSRDLREEIFRGLLDKKVTAVITAEDSGVVAGIMRAKEKALDLGLEIEVLAEDGAEVKQGETILRITGNPIQIALAEDFLIGLISKTSGIATAARRAVQLAEGNFIIVSGAWKKIPPAIKDIAREAVVLAGALPKIDNKPFIYLDKNYVKIFGGVKEALKAVERMDNSRKVAQLKKGEGSIGDEAVKAVKAGADIIIVDTGDPCDLDIVANALRASKMRGKVKIAFAGGVRIRDLPKLKEKDVDIVEIGKEIVDAALLDMRMDVVDVDDG